jgi:hypothetical protein
MEHIINIGLLKNPLNWVIIALMLILAFLGAEIVFNQFSTDKA